MYFAYSSLTCMPRLEANACFQTGQRRIILIVINICTKKPLVALLYCRKQAYISCWFHPSLLAALCTDVCFIPGILESCWTSPRSKDPAAHKREAATLSCL